MDVSPSYIYGEKHIIKAIQDLKYQIKLLLILRDPTERFISFYKQGVKNGRISIHESLNQFFQKSKLEFEKYIDNKDKKDNFYNRSLREGCYSIYLPCWIESFNENLKIVMFDELIDNETNLIIDIYKWLGLEIFENIEEIEHSNKSYKPRSQKVSVLANKIFLKNEKIFRKHSGLKNFLKKVYLTFNIDKYELKDVDMVKKNLHQFYENYNKELIGILPEKRNIISAWLQ